MMCLHEFKTAAASNLVLRFFFKHFFRNKEREREREREREVSSSFSHLSVFENVIIFIYVYVCVMVCCRMEGEERERGEKRKRLYGYTPSHLYISPFVEEDMKDNNVRCYVTLYCRFLAAGRRPEELN